TPKPENYQAIILAVAHNEFKQLNIIKTKDQIIYDIKSFLDPKIVDGKL
ncbi:MAG: nucleotide sugar dehydrogenase, partial [Proteobacteria bacterium]|nr:nucleotide sugar dehydrogenase [Pseudomonadota bacterium]